MSGVLGIRGYLMSRLPSIGTTPYFFNRHAAPPEDDGDCWTLEVQTVSRARPPVPVKFLGTVHHEKPDPFASEEARAARKAELREEAESNAKALERAVFILSQSPTGRDVLERMTAEGYRIAFDDRRTGDRDAGGLCDPSDKTIVLRGHENPEYLALLLGHECVHAVQNTRHDLFPSTAHRPEAGIKLSFAIEADAYAQQTQIALELAYGDPEGPRDQIRLDGPLQQMRERFPNLVRAAERVMGDEKSLSNGATVAAVFEAFYDDFHLRTFYEDSHIEWAETYAPQAKKSARGWLQKPFAGDADSDWVKSRLQHKGEPYLERHAPHLRFDDARHSGITQETAERVKDFYAKHLPKEKKPSLKIFGTHMKDAVSIVMGFAASVHAVLRNPANGPHFPPLRPPPTI